METKPLYRKNILIRMLQWIAKPVSSQLAFFVLCFVLLNLLDLFVDGGFPSLSPFQKISFGFFVCYSLLFISTLLPTCVKGIYKSVVLILAVIQFVVDLFLLIVYGETFSSLHVDMLAAFVATNMGEVSEYLRTYLTLEVFIIVIALLLSLFVSFYYLRRLNKIKNTWFGECIIAVVVLVSASVSFMDYKNFILGNWLFLLECESPNLIEYKQEPSVECGDKKPDFIVLVVGESFSKEHSSLYDYDKETNPLLKKLVTDSSLFVCNDVVSACTKTIPAMKSIMTSYVDEMRDSIDWYQCLTLIEIMQSINYRSVWVSNQSRVGFFDNVSGCFAELCDESVFANERGLNGYDEVLLPIIHDIVDSDSLQMFLIVNLMGSHISYNSRYPASFSNFEPDDYVVSHPHLSDKCRQTLSEYDNSILYNDSVVYEIIKIFEQKDAFVLYISDHGQDVFKSSNEYAGHAINGNPVSEQVSVKIPMFFYTSPAFLNKHPELYNRIRSTINRPYRTDSVMYTIMDVAGIETVNGVSYKHKSLFK